MRVWVVVAMLVAGFALVPGAEAHQCSGTDCGPCVKGETHQHADEKGSCNSGPGFIQDAGYGGASNKVPALGVLVTLTLVGVAALAFGRRV